MKNHLDIIFKWKNFYKSGDRNYIWPQKCKSHDFDHCFFFLGNKFQYFIIGNITKFYLRNVWSKQHMGGSTHYKKSWEDAFALCKKMQGSLPYFYNRDELQELIGILKKSTYLPLMEAIFVDNKHRANKVSPTLLQYFFFLNLKDTYTYHILVPLVPLFWIYGDISSGFQSQSGFCLTRFFVEASVVYIP